MLFKPIMSGLCHLHELRTIYSLDDLLDFHEAIDEWDKAIAAAQMRPGEGAPRRR